MIGVCSLVTKISSRRQKVIDDKAKCFHGNVYRFLSALFLIIAIIFAWVIDNYPSIWELAKIIK